MQRTGTTTHGVVASTSCVVRPAAQRLGERHSLRNSEAGITWQFLPQTSLTQGRRQRRRLETQSAFFDPPPFNPSKLRVRYLQGASEGDASPPSVRRYTLTHNDLTGALTLSIGSEYNQDQLSGWYTRILRDEVLAEWHLPQGAASMPSLNVFCHVSGEEMWPAPPGLRSFIFQREMKLVLDTIAYAERRLLSQNLRFAAAPIYVHLVSDMESLNKVISWGVLGDRSSWQKQVSRRGGIFAEIFPSIDNSDLEEEQEGEDAEDTPAVGEALATSVNGEGLGNSLLVQEGQAGATSAAPRVRGALSKSANGTANGTVGARRSPLGAGVLQAPGRTGSKIVSVAAHRGDSMWPASVQEDPLASGEGVRGVPVEARLSDTPRRK